MTDDSELVARIGRLVEEEHRIEREHAGATMPDEERRRLHDIEVALDQCWDLLRQRRARRAVGQPADDAAVRPEDVVERYQQ